MPISLPAWVEVRSGDTRPEWRGASGVYGTGTSAVAEEIARILEEAGSPYAAIDVDRSW